MPQCKAGKAVHLSANKKKKHSSKTRMPLCQYGAACTRRDCVYRHETRGSEVKKTAKVCMAFLSGSCQFGRTCFNRHPPPDECATLRAKYRLRACTFGAQCRTAGCLYRHPWDNAADALRSSKTGNRRRHVRRHELEA